MPEEPLYLVKLGRVEILVKVAGEGVMRRPVAMLRKIVHPEVLQADPSAARTWEMEDLAALEIAIKRILEQSIGDQSLTVMKRPEPTESAGEG